MGGGKSGGGGLPPLFYSSELNGGALIQGGVMFTMTPSKYTNGCFPRGALIQGV
jgi:hypothetical protein